MRINSNLRWLFWIGFFVILLSPLLNLPPWFSPPDWGKTIIFRSILSILLFVFLWQILNTKEASFDKFSKKVKIGLSILLGLFGIFLLATLFSLEPYFSFWGNPYRSGGFLNFAFYIIFTILAFLILEESDWKKIWDFSIFVGILVSLVAIFQWQGWFEEFLITYKGRPPATTGGPIFLAIYLLLLSFLTLSFGLKEKHKFKKIFYFSSLLLFIFVILLTYTRAAVLGLFVGILYFLLFYPKKLIWLKISAFIFLILGIFFVYWANTTKEFPEFIKENKVLTGFINRLSIKRALKDPRISGWKVSLEALKDRPILGYGPENFSIGFDKYYDPTLPNITKIAGGGGLGWWDRAHNFILDISLQAGILALVIYLCLFGFLFWQLQKLKVTNLHEYKNESTRIIAHGIQSAFLAYLAANFFSFDVFSTFLVSSLIIGYSLSLINLSTRPSFVDNSRKIIFWKFKKYKGIILILLFVLLIWFIWSFNIKPFQINTQINVAQYQQKQGDCQGAIQRMENIIKNHTFLDNYLRLKYVNIIKKCLTEKNPEFSYQIAKRGVEILKENIKIRPYYTRNWLFLGILTNYLLDAEKTSQTSPERITQLKEEANFAFENAIKLSPKRQETLIEWIKTDLTTGEFEKAREKSEQCIQLDPTFSHCYWMAGLAEIYLKNLTKAQEYLKIASQKKYPVNSEISLLQLTLAYAFIKDYQQLVQVYQKLIKIDPKNPQYHASLAVSYKEVGDYKNAKKEALRVLELSPASKKEVEKFLKNLPNY